MPIDYSKMFKCNFSVLKNIDFNDYLMKKRFSEICIDFEDKDINRIYKFIISKIYKIDKYLWKIENNRRIKENENMFNYLRFSLYINKHTIYTSLCLYKLLIIIVCFYMKELPTKNIDIFYSILNDNSILEILLNVKRDKTLQQGTFVENIQSLKNIFFNGLSGKRTSRFGGFVDTINRNLIDKFDLQLKVYYKKKYMPNFNYSINGYFTDDSKKISKVGLRGLEEYIYLIRNEIYFRDFIYLLNDDREKPLKEMFYSKIEPLSNFCVKLEKTVYHDDDPDRISKQSYLLVDMLNDKTIKYIDQNYEFMFHNAKYPTKLDSSLKRIKKLGEEDTVEFIKGNYRSLKQLMLEEKIFSSDSNIVFLISCANSMDQQSDKEVRYAEDVSDDEQEITRKKYLKYKKKYLALKKKLNL